LRFADKFFLNNTRSEVNLKGGSFVVGYRSKKMKSPKTKYGGKNG
jgi:hypothetical protein